MVELDGLEGYSFGTSAEKIKVKDKIEYEKIDVSDEIKDQSEVDASKEDTAQKTETEEVLADTVEWVISEKKAAGTEVTYKAVDKSTIAEPSLTASLNFDFGILRIMQQSMLADNLPIPIDEDPSATIKVSSITLSQTSLNLSVGAEPVTLTATVAPTEATDKTVTWSSSDATVAKVEGGKVTALKGGSATITATANDGSDVAESCTVSVTEPTPPTVSVSSITLSGTSALTVGQTTTLTATVAPAEATNRTVTWTSSDASVASVDSSSGLITGLAAGQTTITATAADGSNVTGTCTVTVSAVAVSSITLSQTSLNLSVGAEPVTLTATVAPTEATDKTVTWTSSDATVAKVEGGKVTALKEGSATITVTANGDTNVTATCAVKVSAATVSVTSVTLDKTNLELEVNGTYTLTATVAPTEATDKTVTWTSSESTIAKVENGKVTALKEGTATITAKAGDKTATCKVTVGTAYDPKKDTTKLLKDKGGNQMYVLVNGQYVEAKVADYYKTNVTFYKKETVTKYIYTGWQNIDGKSYYFDKNGNKVTGQQVIQGAKYNFNSDGTLNTGSGVLGIDVSTWNGNIDWNKVKNSGVSYVIIRTGYRGSTQGALVEDNKFRQNIKGATNAGLKVGVYFFTQAINEVEAVEEASMVLSQIKGYKLAYPVFIDVESSGGRADGLSTSDRTKIVNAFCQTIQNNGYRAGIYANKTWFTNKLNTSALSGYKIWLAQYNSSVTYKGRYDMWQYSDKGKINGISGNVDMNLSYLSY